MGRIQLSRTDSRNYLTGEDRLKSSRVHAPSSRRPTLHQIEAQLAGKGSDGKDPRLAVSPSAPVTEVLPVVLGSIGELAFDLYAGREITHADVCVALGLTDGGGPGSFELTMSRSAMPGPFPGAAAYPNS